MGKRAMVILGSVFAVALAVVVGRQLPTEAMAVVVGVVCGVVAAIPTSLLLLVVLTRRERQAMERGQRQGDDQGEGYPPVVVIQRDPATPSIWEMEPWPRQAPARTEGWFYLAEGDDLLPRGG
jgi:hypothetical protein